MADAIPAAARFEDPIFHTNALAGALWGLAVGLVVGLVVAAVVIGSVASGGLLLAAVAAIGTAVIPGLVALGTIAGAVSLVCTGVSLGFGFGSFIGEHSGGSIVGKIEHASPDTFIGGEELQAAHVEVPVKCSHHSEEPKIAQGSKTVYINKKNASRIEDKITCGAAIKKGCATVGIGGETVTLLPIESEVGERLEWWVDKIDILGVVLGFVASLASLGTKKAAEEIGLAAGDLGLLSLEKYLSPAPGQEGSNAYTAVVWTRRGYEAVLMGRAARNAVVERAEAAEELARGNAPSHILGPNGEAINMRGEPIPGPTPTNLGSDGHIIDPSAPTPQPNAHVIDPTAPTPQPNAHIIDPSAPTPQPNAHIIDPSAPPTPGTSSGLLGADGRPIGG